MPDYYEDFKQMPDMGYDLNGQPLYAHNSQTLGNEVYRLRKENWLLRRNGASACENPITGPPWVKNQINRGIIEMIKGMEYSLNEQAYCLYDCDFRLLPALFQDFFKQIQEPDDGT